MPFYIRLKTTASETTPNETDRGPFGDRRSAHAAIADPATETIAYVYAETDRADWTARERSRFRDGTYQEIPWSSCDTQHLHFAHLSIDAPGMIAYTPDDEFGYGNRKIKINPGRYLERFYADVPQSTRSQWIARCTYVKETLSIATTPDDIETVYRNAHGFQSCMGPDGHASFDLHPTRVYGNSDLACAYLGPIDRAIARAIVWPAKKRYARAYGSDRLIPLLENAGYVKGSIVGAKIRAIAHRSGYLMPYVDTVDRAENLDNGFLLLGSGSIDTQTTNGHTDMVDDRDETACDHCGEYVYDDEISRRGYCQSCEDRRQCCEHCNDEFFADDDECSQYCRSCEDSRSYCECCDSDHWDNSTFAVSRDEYVCEDCARSHDESKFTCEHCACEDNREWEMDRDRQSARIDNGSALRFCEDCEPIVTVCHACTAVYEPAEHPYACPECAIAPRCTETPDLLAEVYASEAHEARTPVLVAS